MVEVALHEVAARHAVQAEGAPRADAIDRILSAVRTHLGMDIAFLSEFVFDDIIMRHVDARPDAPIHAGDVFPSDGSYCKRIVDGRMPGLIPDTSLNEEAQGLECTFAVPVGAHLSVPVRLRGGRLYGTFCCFSHDPDRSLNMRDFDTLTAFAAIAAQEVQERIDRASDRERKVTRIADAIARERFQIAYQPIVERDGSVIGFECLARFSDADQRSPRAWFEEADDVGLGAELELAALRAGMSGLAYFPKGIFVAVNVSPAVVRSDALADIVRTAPPGRLMLEITGHDADDGDIELGDAIAKLRPHVLVSVDNVGVAFSGLRRVVDVTPDVIKLDMTLVRGIYGDARRSALARAMVAVAAALGCRLVACGVESAAELATLRAMGVPAAQGFHIAEPMPIAAACVFLNERTGGPIDLTLRRA